MNRLLIVFLVSIIIAIILFIGINVYIPFLSVSNNETEVNVTIPKGSTGADISKILKEKSIIKSELFFQYRVMKSDVSTDFKVGTYIIPANQKIDLIIKQFAEGTGMVKEEDITVKVTIPEGFTISQIADRLSEKGVVNKEEFLNEVSNWNGNEWFLEEINGPKRLEGFMYPDTYEFYKDSESKIVIKKFLSRFDEVFRKHQAEIKNPNVNMKDIITIASLIEKEAKHDEDRKKISGVIYNRLMKDMLLQIDASILYDIGHKDRITSNELQIDSPYNLYKYKGLPPTPIASPGEASIVASINPEISEYLFYVADKNTSYHHFAKTYEEHLKNIKDYYK